MLHLTCVGESPSWLRHWILIPACEGSNPSSPAKFDVRAGGSIAGESPNPIAETPMQAAHPPDFMVFTGNANPLMAADIATRDGSVYGFRVTRSEGAPAFTPAELDLARRLLPHIKRALNLYLTMNQDRRVNTLYGHAMTQLMIGVVVLDQTGEVIEVNPAAKAILDMSDGVRVIGRQLEATYANDNRKLQRLIRDALMHPEASKMALTEAMPISRPSGQQSWGAVVQSISSDQWSEGRQRPSVAVFVRDTDGKAAPPVRLAQQLFQLTPAETALAIQLANGLSLEEAAEALNIRRNTARAHLRSIFSKTGVRRQTELVRIFLNSVAWLGARE